MTFLHGTPEELSRFLKLHPELLSKTDKNQMQPTINKDIEPSSRENHWTPASMRDFHARMYGKQKELIRIVIEKGGRATKQDVKDHFKFNSEQSISGLLAAITKNACHATQSDKAMFFQYGFKDEAGPKKRAAFYSIASELLELIRELKLDFSASSEGVI